MPLIAVMMKGYVLETGYLADGVTVNGMVHRQITFNMHPTRSNPWTGVVTLDPNAYVLDRFGETGAGTLAAPQTLTIALERIEEVDGTELLSVKGDSALNLQVVAIPDPYNAGGWLYRLLALDGSGKVTKVLNLLPS